METLKFKKVDEAKSWYLKEKHWGLQVTQEWNAYRTVFLKYDLLRKAIYAYYDKDKLYWWQIKKNKEIWINFVDDPKEKQILKLRADKIAEILFEYYNTIKKLDNGEIVRWSKIDKEERKILATKNRKTFSPIFDPKNDTIKYFEHKKDVERVFEIYVVSVFDNEMFIKKEKITVITTIYETSDDPRYCDGYHQITIKNSKKIVLETYIDGLENIKMLWNAPLCFC